MEKTDEIDTAAVRYAVEAMGWEPGIRIVARLPNRGKIGLYALIIEGGPAGKRRSLVALSANSSELNAEIHGGIKQNRGLRDDAAIPGIREKYRFMRIALFYTGPVVSTPGALEALTKNGSIGRDLLERHLRGDWGNLCADDWAANNTALQTGARLFSAYRLPDGTDLWLITDAEIDELHNRQATTFLLPGEY